MEILIFVAYIIISLILIVAIPSCERITDILDDNELLDALAPQLIILWPITLIPSIVYLIYKNYNK